MSLRDIAVFCASPTRGASLFLLLALACSAMVAAAASPQVGPPDPAAPTPSSGTHTHRFELTMDRPLLTLPSAYAVQPGDGDVDLRGKPPRGRSTPDQILNPPPSRPAPYASTLLDCGRCDVDVTAEHWIAYGASVVGANVMASEAGRTRGRLVPSQPPDIRHGPAIELDVRNGATIRWPDDPRRNDPTPD